MSAWTPAPCSPAIAAERARFYRQYANLPDATPAERAERSRRARLFQDMAACGTHPHGDRTEEGAA